MALGDSYATLSEFKTRLGISSSTYDTQLTEALAAASRSVEAVAQRQFNKASSASARLFYPDGPYGVTVDDFYTTTGLVIATDRFSEGTYETTWEAEHYQLEPFDGIVNGESGWPYSRIRAVSTHAFPLDARRPPIRVTAAWGWNAVPSPVKEATLIAAEELYKLKDAPFGVAGFAEFGVVRVRENPFVEALVGRYRRSLMVA